jgi:hypothetical protein
VNRGNADALQGLLSEDHPYAEVTVTAEPDGATVVISGSVTGCGPVSSARIIDQLRPVRQGEERSTEFAVRFDALAAAS